MQFRRSEREGGVGVKRTGQPVGKHMEEAEKESRLETRKDLQFFKQDGLRAGCLWVLSSPTETVASNPVFRMEVRIQ